MSKRTYLVTNIDSRDMSVWHPTRSLSSISCLYHGMEGEVALVKQLESEYLARLAPVVSLSCNPTGMAIHSVCGLMSGMKFPGIEREGEDAIDFLVIDLGPSSQYPTADDAVEAVYGSDGDKPLWLTATGYKSSK